MVYYIKRDSLGVVSDAPEKQAAAESKLLDAAQKLLACRTLGIRHHADLDADLELAARELIAVIDAAHNALHGRR